MLDTEVLTAIGIADIIDPLTWPPTPPQRPPPAASTPSTPNVAPLVPHQPALLNAPQARPEPAHPLGLGPANPRATLVRISQVSIPPKRAGRFSLTFGCRWGCARSAGGKQAS